MPTLKPYTFAIRSKPTAQTKIAKEYVLPTLKAGRKIKNEMLTKCINHWAVVIKSKLVHINKGSNKPKEKCF